MSHHFAKSFWINDKFSVHRKMNQSAEDVPPENSSSITSNPHPFPLGFDEYNCLIFFAKSILTIQWEPTGASCIIFELENAFSISITLTLFTHQTKTTYPPSIKVPLSMISWTWTLLYVTENCPWFLEQTWQPELSWNFTKFIIQCSSPQHIYIHLQDV